MKFMNTRILKMFLLSMSLGLWAAGCGDNSTGTGGNDNGNGNGNGDEDPPTEPTFANVQQIFSNSCGGSGCHIGEQTNGVQLDSYDEVMSSVGTLYGEKIVVPDSADVSPLVDKIEADPEFGERMPKNGSPLSSDKIDLIKDWINEGAQNN